MKFITKMGVMCTTIAMMASTLSYAGTVSTTKLYDKYIGANGTTLSSTDFTPNSNYNTKWMKVSKDLQAGLLTVEVKSNFIGYDSSFKLGDLFLMDGTTYNNNLAKECLTGKRGCEENSYTDGTNKWEYAFDLGLNLGDTSIKNSESNYSNKLGALRKIDQSGDVTEVSSFYHDSVNTSSQLSKNVRKWQIVDVKSTADKVVGGDGSWETDVSDKLLTMAFDISGTSLMQSDQIALRWAMSCANDIIEVVTNFKTSTSVPEPSTLFLMLLAGFGLFTFRQKKEIKFKA